MPQNISAKKTVKMGYVVKLGPSNLRINIYVLKGISVWRSNPKSQRDLPKIELSCGIDANPMDGMVVSNDWQVSFYGNLMPDQRCSATGIYQQFARYLRPVGVS